MEEQPQKRNKGRGKYPKHDRIPAWVLAERKKAFEAPLTLTQAIFGDPLPGRSALDKMPPPR